MKNDLALSISDQDMSILFSGDAGKKTAVSLPEPVVMEIWNPRKGSRTLERFYQITDFSESALTGTVSLEDPESGIQIIITDCWLKYSEDSFRIFRTVKVIKGSEGYGIRTGMNVELFPEEKPDFTQLQYFAPPAIYDKNDLDEDGIDDYFLTQDRLIRDDRLNTLSFMAYHPQNRMSVTMIRSDIPKYDEYPCRPDKETSFLQRTDVGSIGIWNGRKGMELRTRFPFYEGPVSLALNSKTKIPWGAYWPADTGESFDLFYELHVRKEKSFLDAMWMTYTGQMEDLCPELVELPASAELLAKYRTYAVDHYYMEKDASQDKNKPAGYVLNCHPQDGRQLCNIIQYGFTGQNTISAYCSLRQGYTDGNRDLIDHGRKTLDFFADRIHIPESGIFYNLYNMEKGKFDFWWTGLILPLAYVEGDRLRELMGPLYEYYKDILPVMKEKQGSYLRCMNEEAYGLICAFDFERKIGVTHENWLATARRYGDFLVRVQAEDGTWYRAYEISGEPITEPAVWFGKTYVEQKGCTSTAVPFLTELYRQTHTKKYLDAALKAGRYVAEVSIGQVRCCGGIHDSIFEKGVLVDNESTLYAMLAMLELYKETGETYFLDWARKGAILFSSWIYLWDLPLPSGSTLKKQGLRTTGLGSCDVPSAGYVHSFENRGVAALTDLAFALKEEAFLDMAQLIWHGCNQTVAVPGRDWNYSRIGLQEEGWLVNWFMAEDPVFSDDAEFGHRWKGEGNKTCYPWISAVALISYWNMKDTYGTADFDEIRRQYARTQQ